MYNADIRTIDLKNKNNIMFENSDTKTIGIKNLIKS